MPSERISRNGTPDSKPKLTLEEREQLANDKLAKRYDALNVLLGEAEVRLRKLRPHRPVWIDYHHRPGSPEGPDSWELLGITQLQGKWRLAHAFDNDFNDDGPMLDVKPIIDCPVEIRVRAAKVVHKLYERMIETKEKYIPEVEKAINDLLAFCGEA